MSRVIGPKGRAFWHLSTGLTFRRFKWEWRVTYQLNQNGTWETYDTGPLENRGAVRKFKQLLPTNARNVKVQRRFIEVDWHDYCDTFSYNAKGNGNGR